MDTGRFTIGGNTPLPFSPPSGSRFAFRMKVGAAAETPLDWNL
jgi:hypothetical protein